MAERQLNYFVLSPFKRCRKDLESCVRESSNSSAHQMSRPSTINSVLISNIRVLGSRRVRRYGRKPTRKPRSKSQSAKRLPKVTGPVILIITNFRRSHNVIEILKMFSVYGRIKSVQTHCDKTGASTGQVDIIFCETKDALAAYRAIKMSKKNRKSRIPSTDAKIVPLKDKNTSKPTKKN